MLIAVLLLGGCAAAPGFQPEGNRKPGLLSHAKQFEAGDVADDGVYKPSENEKALDCKRLLGSMKVMISRLKDSQNRPQPSIASVAGQKIGEAVGKKSIDMTVEEKRERARLVAYNRLLTDKQCQPLDIERELNGGGDAPAATPTPAPAKKK